MVKKEVKKQEAVKEDLSADDSEIDGDELFDGLESVSSD
jgi:hypothetical protein